MSDIIIVFKRNVFDEQLKQVGLKLTRKQQQQAITDFRMVMSGHFGKSVMRDAIRNVKKGRGS